MQVSTLYSQYQIPPNLARHQLEVTAVGRYICDHWVGDPVDKELITQTLLLHDMGNILKFKRPFTGEISKEHAYWEAVQDEYRRKYGDSVEDATFAIVLELGRPDIVELIKEMTSIWKSSETNVSNEARICEYADCCVMPSGISTFNQRIEDVKLRYAYHETDSEITSMRRNGSIVDRSVNVDLHKLIQINFEKEFALLRSHKL